MSYIYVITNKINGKQYVGKTHKSIAERWAQHCSDKEKRTAEKRPLYNALNKYGIENFSIDLLEECDYKEANKKEIYWIGKLDTYKNGYNATLGGDGKTLYDYEEIANKYQELHNQKLTADYFNCDVHTVKTACELMHVPTLGIGQVTKKLKGKKVYMCDLKTHEILQEFEDQSEAAKWLINNNITTAQIKNISCLIGRVAQGKRKSAYNYYWTYK